MHWCAEVEAAELLTKWSDFEGTDGASVAVVCGAEKEVDRLMATPILFPACNTSNRTAGELVLLMGAGWLRRRQRVGERTGVPEDRRFFNLMYTDDALFGAVGIDATLNLLREWRGVTSEAGLIMAIPKKREIGTCVGAPAGLQVVREPQLMMTDTSWRGAC